LRLHKKTRITLVSFVLAAFLLLALLNNPIAAAQEAEQQDLEAEMKFLKALIHFIQENYYTDVDTDELIKGACKGIIESLEDPYSTYFSPREYTDFSEQASGTYSGIGVVITKKDKYIVVVSPMPDGPAARAGIEAGDRIIMADDKELTGMDLSEAASYIKGPKGTKVTLKIMREGETNLLTFTIERDEIEINPVDYRVIDNQIGYIRLMDFNEHAFDHIIEALYEFELWQVKGILLDLRNNPGGLLDQAFKVADIFVPKGKTIVKIVRDEGEVLEELKSVKQYKQYPLVVLVNGGSASASEIVAGAIQDNGAGTIIGTKTFGKATVQKTVNLGKLGGFKVTVARYQTPAGRDINEVGIQPDVVVEPLKVQLPEFAPLGDMRVLKKGVIGLDVYGVQQRLKYLGYYQGEENGIYDQSTARAVADFQAANNLPVKGYVDEATYRLLEKAVQEKPHKRDDVQLKKALEILRQHFDKKVVNQ